MQENKSMFMSIIVCMFSAGVSYAESVCICVGVLCIYHTHILSKGKLFVVFTLYTCAVFESTDISVTDKIFQQHS